MDVFLPQGCMQYSLTIPYCHLVVYKANAITTRQTQQCRVCIAFWFPLPQHLFFYFIFCFICIFITELKLKHAGCPTFSWLIVNADGLCLVLAILPLHTNEVRVCGLIKAGPNGQYMLIGFSESLHQLINRKSDDEGWTTHLGLPVDH